MRKKFNNGKPFHGSSAVQDGKLQGATDTDYFYFFCPKCGDRNILRILDFEARTLIEKNSYDAQMKSKAACGFTLAFKLHCDKCRMTDFVKVSNLGWQAGSL